MHYYLSKNIFLFFHKVYSGSSSFLYLCYFSVVLLAQMIQNSVMRMRRTRPQTSVRHYLEMLSCPAMSAFTQASTSVAACTTTAPRVGTNTHCVNHCSPMPQHVRLQELNFQTGKLAQPVVSICIRCEDDTVIIIHVDLEGCAHRLC